MHRLRAEGWLVEYVAEMESGLEDPQVLALARERGALLLTTDKDFGELVFRQGSKYPAEASASAGAPEKGSSAPFLQVP